ncbi:MAG: hypothetical protein ACQEQ2_05645 [Pseudomonadota bacterium]
MTLAYDINDNGGGMNNADIIRRYTDGFEATPEKTEKGLNVALNILDKWLFNTDEKSAVLGLPEGMGVEDRTSIVKTADNELHFRLSIIIGLWVDLRAVTSSAEIMTGWLRRPLPDGRIPKDILMSNDCQEMLNLRSVAKSLAF